MANTTWNGSDKTANITLSGGGLVATCTDAFAGGVRAIDKQVSGKFYWEFTCTVFLSSSSGVGLCTSNVVLGTQTISSSLPGICGINRNGQVFAQGGAVTSSMGTITSGTVVCCAFDCDSRLAWFRLGAAGNWNNSASANPATGVGGVASNLGRGLAVYPMFLPSSGNTESVTANWGDSGFVGAVPSGYTSGFTAGVTSPTNALASQALAEHWLTTDPQAQITQVLVEHWQSVASGNLQAVVTQVLIEHWMSVASVSPASGGPQVTMIH